MNQSHRRSARHRKSVERVNKEKALQKVAQMLTHEMTVTIKLRERDKKILLRIISAAKDPKAELNAYVTRLVQTDIDTCFNDEGDTGD